MPRSTVFLPTSPDLLYVYPYSPLSTSYSPGSSASFVAPHWPQRLALTAPNIFPSAATLTPGE